MQDATDDAFSTIVHMYDKTPPAVIPPCPSWCVSPYCARGLDYFEFDNDGLAMRTHVAFNGEMGVHVGVDEQHHADGSFSLKAPEIMYDDCVSPGGGLDVTPDMARTLSDELREAADVVDRITSPDMHADKAPDRDDASPRSVFVEALWRDSTLSREAKAILLNAYDEALRIADAERAQRN